MLQLVELFVDPLSPQQTCAIRICAIDFFRGFLRFFPSNIVSDKSNN